MLLINIENVSYEGSNITLGFLILVDTRVGTAGTVLFLLRFLGPSIFAISVALLSTKTKKKNVK